MGNKLKKARETARMTQEELSKKKRSKPHYNFCHREQHRQNHIYQNTSCFG